MYNSSSRVVREKSNRVEWSIEEYDTNGGVTSTTIRIEACASEGGGSSRKSTSTRRRQRQTPRPPVWLANAEEEFVSAPRVGGGKTRCAVKTPFSTGSVAPYNKKLRKKSTQHRFPALGRTPPMPPPSSSRTQTTTATTEEAEVSFNSSFFISPTHRAVAEATTPWANTRRFPNDGRYQFLGHGGMVAEERWESGSRALGPMRSPSLLPPLEMLPASKAELCSEVLEQCLLEATLHDGENGLGVDVMDRKGK